MASEYSFDVVSKVDLQAIDNSVNSANREISTRYDFRGSVSKLTFDKKEGNLTLYSDDEGKLKSVVDVLQSRLVKQGIDLKALDFGKIEPAEKATVRQTAKIVQGIPSDKAKEMVRSIKDKKLKVTASIQGDQLRISGKSKDALQEVMDVLRGQDFGVALQFTNYR